MLPVHSRQLGNVKGELLKLMKKKTADCQLWHNVASTEETKEQNNSRLTVMAERGQKRERKKTKNIKIADCQTTCHNVARREERKKPKNNEIADCQTWHNVARREEPKKTEEQRDSRLVRQDVSRDLSE
ncbi:hypothetical protein AVEN_230114-1 [Araneus ventricosus]|uniref:Uncharacterized protein n=1 Tax=Araneus ventricosus TaxID=182803 RepID=A0A4Y2P0K1_ARAVE|nr:hypothetical protein AVEN_230114-1 [Araneus ventricosus]